jgi:hypothetical protein
MAMKKWWWRIALAVIGLVLISCALCLVTYSHLEKRREVEQDVVPIEIPPGEPTPESRWLGLEVV